MAERLAEAVERVKSCCFPEPAADEKKVLYAALIRMARDYFLGVLGGAGGAAEALPSEPELAVAASPEIA